MLVQGRVAVDRTWPSPDSIVTRLALVDARRAGGAWPLDLQWSHPDPLLGSLVLPPRRPQVGRLGIYRVRLDSLSTGPFPSADLVLLNADPTGR